MSNSNCSSNGCLLLVLRPEGYSECRQNKKNTPRK